MHQQHGVLLEHVCDSIKKRNSEEKTHIFLSLKQDSTLQIPEHSDSHHEHLVHCRVV